MHLFFSGFSDVNNNSWTIQDALNDSLRLKYHQLHLSSLLKATRWISIYIHAYIYIYIYIYKPIWEKIQLESKLNFNWNLILCYVSHQNFLIFVSSELIQCKIQGVQYKWTIRNSIVYLIIFLKEKWYVHNIFTINPKWQVVVIGCYC